MRVIVTTMKDEGPFMLEWVAYHQSIGFDHFIINTNDCSDGTDKIAMRLEEMGIATHIDNPGPWKKGPQGAAYDNAMAHPKLGEAEWILVSDADEFLNIKVGDGTLDALFAARPDANMFSFTWQLFGHNGVVEFEDQPVTQQFTRAADPYQQWPAMCRAFKTLYRADAGYSLISTHRPKGLKRGGIRRLNWVDGDGDDMTAAFAFYGWRASNLGLGFGNDLARMNHYATRSLDSYLMKRIRGDVRTSAYHKKLEETGVNYWTLHCWNSVEDDSIGRSADRMMKGLAALKKDKALSALHKKAVAYHTSRIAEVKQTEAARHFEEVFADYVGGFDWVPGHDVVTCPDLALDPQRFDPSHYLKDLRAARANELKLARKNRRRPWFADSDLSGASAVASEAGDITEVDAAAYTALEQAPPVRPRRRKARQALLGKVGKDKQVWAILGSGEIELVEDVLASKSPSKLFVFNSWGFEANQFNLPLKQGEPNEALMAREGAYLAFMERFAEQIKAGRLSLGRANPLHALKTLPHGYLDGVWIAGVPVYGAALPLVRRAIGRITDGGVLITDGYHRRSSRGDAMIRALHDVMGEMPHKLRGQDIEGAHLALQVLPPLEQTT